MALRRIILATAILVLQASLAHAGCSVGALPFILQNNTVADATQVDADFNQITSGINSNCAAAGANNDITSLSALSTPLSPVQGGSPVFAGGLTGGSANAQTLATLPTSSLTFGGATVTGHWGFANTGAMTLSINGGVAVPVYRRHQFGVGLTVGGEAIVNHPFVLVYDQTNNRLLLNSELVIIGEMKTVGYAPPVPLGWLIADGSSFVCSSFQDLCNTIGQTYGGTASNPNLPDTRGRMMTGLDNYGTGIGAAGRLNNIITGCGTSFTLLGVTCANASERHFQQLNELANHGHGLTDPGHVHGITDPGHFHALPNSVVSTGSGANGTTTITGSNLQITSTSASTTSVSVQQAATGISLSNTGSGAAMPIVNPNIGMIMIIKY